MEKKSFGKLQLNRETLRKLTNGELEQVVGGATNYECSNPDYCDPNTAESLCYYECPGTGDTSPYTWDCTAINTTPIPYCTAGCFPG